MNSANNPALAGTDVHLAPLREAEVGQFDSEFDLIIVGYGGAGASAALQALENGASVALVDRFDGGGATAICGSVIYAGGGTDLQRRLNIEDSADNMFNYLRNETQGIVSDETLRRFCDGSADSLRWLQKHGLRFSGDVFSEKTTYPVDGYSLYFSGNELDPMYRKTSEPVARGHIPDGIGKYAAFGPALYNPLARSIDAMGPARFNQCRVDRLIVSDNGRVVGIEATTLAPTPLAAWLHRFWSKAATAVHMYYPPLADFFRGKLKAIEARHKKNRIRLRATKGVVLSTGGFVFNQEMVKYHMPEFVEGMRLGTTGDDGSGIALGHSVGGKLENMHKGSGWRFINPPADWPKAILVNRKGERYISETLYGAAIGTKMFEEHGGDAILIMDAPHYEKCLKQVNLNTARPITILQFKDATRKAIKAESLEELAMRCNIDAPGLAQTVARYNATVEAGDMDEFGKAPEKMVPISTGPFYAIDLSPTGGGITPVITLGGLAVNEESGQVLDQDGRDIEGLYAAGRTAVGIASNNYVTGLSVADCVFSGRRAANHATGASS